ncbi:GntR family transcriptional regulator [Facklamia sp. 7083-14-GEN3]|uniref:GntR family transcriptional regulator n=1 Tax=Facklamia sp. 7083-14-GEN3 TaxID=2973478 RepID=UPI00215CC954|nr:GntR family transcriptional regulator [Facklamia sp. 7083-14-GEN3]MCR8968426.1 GntR family transcriptional regulator [Facklamia sp. 7083-14-GEN3]
MPLGAVSKKVYQYIKSGIISGMWDNQERINEQKLAKELAVSRTSIRKAMKILEEEGFLQSIDNRGMIVTYLTDRDVEEVYQCRQALEMAWFQQLQQRISEHDVIRLLSQLNQLKALEVSGKQINVWQVEADFYNRLFTAVELPVYQEMLTVAMKRLRFMQQAGSVSSRDQDIFLRYYRQILVCLNHANHQILKRIVRQTLEFSQSLAIESLGGKHDHHQGATSFSTHGEMFECLEADCPLLTAFMRPS